MLFNQGIIDGMFIGFIHLKQVNKIFPKAIIMQSNGNTIILIILWHMIDIFNASLSWVFYSWILTEAWIVATKQYYESNDTEADMPILKSELFHKVDRFNLFLLQCYSYCSPVVTNLFNLKSHFCYKIKFV